MAQKTMPTTVRLPRALYLSIKEEWALPDTGQRGTTVTIRVLPENIVEIRRLARAYKRRLKELRASYEAQAASLAVSDFLAA